MTGTRIADLMQPAPTTIRCTSTLREAAEVLTRGEIGSVVVERNAAMAGFLSERDIVRALADGEDPDEARVEDVMSMDVATLGPDDRADEAAEQMLAGAIRHLPVVDGDRVVGIVSIRDVLAHDHAG
ncbi:MAG: CBS domain-containing protein [Actinomycetota bacterium]